MRFHDVWIPAGGYWSTPFCAWQGSFATQPPIPFAAQIAKRALTERNIPGDQIDGLCLGTTVPSRYSFFGAPWFAGLAGLGHLTGPTINQACATSVRCLIQGAEELASGGATVYLAATADRTSNGPHLVYPNPGGPGGTGESEDWVLDNFGRDPYAENSMLETAENVAREADISRQAQEEMALLRHRQYAAAVGNGAAVQTRFMIRPVKLRDARGRKVLGTVTGDEGIHSTTAEGLAGLKPLLAGGTVTYGTQTHPADGNAAIILTAGPDRAASLARDRQVSIQLLSAAQARVKRGFMPAAVVPAARLALERAGIGPPDLASITTHVPFALNDVYLARELKLDPERMNRQGCSLVWGHPQGPTGIRSVIELIEDLILRGGGWGLFTGCAAGDSAAAVVLRVSGG